MKNVKETIKDRNSSYGDYGDQSEIAEQLIIAMENTPGWSKLCAYKKQSMRMIQYKIARLLNGNSNHVDSWHDIAGYAELAKERCVTAPIDVDYVPEKCKSKKCRNFAPGFHSPYCEHNYTKVRMCCPTSFKL